MPWTFDATYPGVTNFRSLDYTTALGITPGCDQHPLSTVIATGSLIAHTRGPTVAEAHATYLTRLRRISIHIVFVAEFNRRAEPAAG